MQTISPRTGIKTYPNSSLTSAMAADVLPVPGGPKKSKCGICRCTDTAEGDKVHATKRPQPAVSPISGGQTYVACLYYPRKELFNLLLLAHILDSAGATASNSTQ